MIKPVRGEGLGRIVASFYKTLREAGFPEDMVQKLTVQYFEERTKVLASIANLGDLLSKLGEHELGIKGEEEKG